MAIDVKNNIDHLICSSEPEQCIDTPLEIITEEFSSEENVQTAACYADRFVAEINYYPHTPADLGAKIGENLHWLEKNNPDRLEAIYKNYDFIVEFMQRTGSNTREISFFPAHLAGTSKEELMRLFDMFDAFSVQVMMDKLTSREDLVAILNEKEAVSKIKDEHYNQCPGFSMESASQSWAMFFGDLPFDLAVKYPEKFVLLLKTFGIDGTAILAQRIETSKDLDNIINGINTLLKLKKLSEVITIQQKDRVKRNKRAKWWGVIASPLKYHSILDSRAIFRERLINILKAAPLNNLLTAHEEKFVSALMVYAYSWDSFISAVKQFGNFEAPFAEQNLQLIFNEIKFLEDLGEHTPQTLQYILSLASKLGADFPKAIEAAKTIWNKCLLVSNNADESWWISSYGAITEYVPDFLKEKVGSHYGVLECRMGPHYIYSTILEELNKKSSLISAGPDNFLEIVDNMDIRYRIKKITSNRVQIKSESDTNLQSYLFSMPPELVSGYPEIVSKLVEGMPILKYGDAHKLNECYRVAFRYRNNPKLLDIVLEHFDSADPLTFNLLEYLIYIKMPDKRLEELLENGEEPAMEDLMTSYRSGKPADIRRFKPEYREVYIELFKSLDKVLLSNGLRSKCFQTLNFEAFLSDLQKMDAIDALELIEYASFPLPPEIKDFLRFKFMSAWVSNNPDFNGMFEEYCADEHIEVTLKNVRNINHLFELLEYATIFPTPNTKILNNTLAANFPDYIYPNSKKERTNWLISRLIIDELDPSKIASVAELSSYLELMEKVKKVENNELLDEMAARLDGLNLDQLVNFGDQKQQAMLYDIEALEKIRKNFNSMIGRTFGDQLVEQAGISFLESHPASFVNLNNLLGFAGAWSAPHKTRSNKNEAGLYQQFSYFAYGLIADFARSRLKEKDYDEAKFEEECHAMSNMPCYSLIDDLEALGFAIRKESNASKVANRILTHTSYTVSRGVSKVFGDGDVVENQSGLQFKPARWPAKDGVEVKIVYQGEKELAKIIKCNRSSKVRILVEKERSVDVKAVETELGKKYIFSAPLSMTTSNGKLIEPAFRDGVQMNWLLTQGGNDGLLVVDSNGNPQILDKREIKLGNILNADDVSGKNQVLTALSKWLKRAKSADVVSTAILDDKISPSENLWDRILFFEILKIKKYSMLGGLLLMSDNELSALQDGSASRRFYVEFEDGDFGIIDSTENMSSADMLEISLMAGVRKAIYMDTGLYDNATYQDGRGGKHALGYHDSEDSTNRVVIYSQE